MLDSIYCLIISILPYISAEAMLQYQCTRIFGTSDYKSDALNVVWLIWILYGVNSLVSLFHSFYDQVGQVGVDSGPTADHIAATHQGHFIRAPIGTVPKRDLHLS